MFELLFFIYVVSSAITVLIFNTSMTRNQIEVELKQSYTDTQYVFIILFFSLTPVLNTIVSYISLNTIIKKVLE